MSNIIQLTSDNWNLIQMIMYASLVVVVFAMGVVFYFLARTPALEFAKCDLLKRTMIPYFTYSRKLIFKACKETNGTVEIDKGIHTLSSDAIINIGGKRGAFCYAAYGPSISPEFMNDAYRIIKEGVENIKVAEGYIDDIRIKALLRNLIDNHVPVSVSILEERGFDKQVVDCWRQIESKTQQERRRWIYDAKIPEDIKRDLYKINDMSVMVNDEYLRTLGYDEKTIRFAHQMNRFNANNSPVSNVLINVYSVLKMLKYNAAPTKWKILNERDKAKLIEENNNRAKGQTNWAQTFVTVFMGAMIFMIVIYIFNAMFLHAGGIGANPAAQVVTQTVTTAPTGGLKI